MLPASPPDEVSSAQSASVSLILLRHGWTRWNHEGRYNSRTDLPLTREGVLSAAGAGEALRCRTINHVVSSPLARARLTAEIVSRKVGLPTEDLVLMNDLREVDFGRFEGLRRSEIEQSELKEDYLAWRNAESTSPAAPGGESWESAMRRADRLLQHFSEGSGCTLVVSHGYTLRMIITRALGIPYGPAIRRLRLDNTAFSELELMDYGWRVNRHNFAAALANEDKTSV